MNSLKSIVENEYVPISAFVELNKLPTIDSINSYTSDKEHTNEIIQYLNWKKSPNELVTFCRAVCETHIPKKFDFLIDLLDENGGINVNAIITHALWNGFIPLNFIDLGYKTITIIKFNNGIPERLNSLKEMDKADFKSRFALCSKLNKEEIIADLKNCN